jgi:hypothetical protein
MPQDPNEVPPVENTVNKRNNICAKCGQPASLFCPKCGQDFCQDHRCIMHSQEFATESTPLPADDEGIVHHGRQIRLIGEGWPNSLRMIREMTDDELRGQIKGLQDLLTDAIRTADYARISIAAREFEVDYREHSRYVAAMKRREVLEQGTVRLNSKKYKKGAPALPPDIAALMKAFGLSEAQATQLKATLGGKV